MPCQYHFIAHKGHGPGTHAGSNTNIYYKILETTARHVKTWRCISASNITLLRESLEERSSLLEGTTIPSLGFDGSSKLAHLLADAHKEAVDALVAAADEQLRKDDGPLGVDCRVGDPVLLRQRGRRVDYKLVCALVVLRRRLHLHRVVACRPHDVMLTTNLI